MSVCECVFAYICCDVCLYDCLSVSVSVWGVYVMGVYERIANQKERGEKEKRGKEITVLDFNQDNRAIIIVL